MEPNLPTPANHSLPKTFWFEAVTILVAIGLGIGGYLYGVSVGVRKAELAAALKAKAEAAAAAQLATKAANPFATDNPLNSITINPFK